MRHMLGDYYSNLDPGFGLWLALILVIVLMFIVVVGLRKQKRDRDARRLANTPPARTRATYLAAQSQKIYDIQEVDNALTRTRP